jgi:hypothetical protein
MATKKKGGVAPAEVPGVLAPGDGNKSIARAKASLAGRWSLSRAESLVDSVQLAWSLVALGREPEACELVDPIADGVSFGGDYKLWTPAASAIAMAARFARRRGDEPRRAALVARLLEHPPVAARAKEELATWLAEANKDIRSAEVESAQKWACQGFASGCTRAAYLREIAAEAAYAGVAPDVAVLEQTIDAGLDGLRVHLAR